LLAKPGYRYLAYNRAGGSATLNLSGQTGSLPGKWINPCDPNVFSYFSVQMGGLVTLNPPFYGDWICYLGNEVMQDQIAPLAPSNLHAENIMPASLRLKWDAPSAAPDGDLAAKYAIYRNNIQVAQSEQTNWTDRTVREDQTYSYSVLAIDDQGNMSQSCPPVQLCTAVDRVEPRLTQVNMIDDCNLALYFSEAIDSISAVQAGNYQILQGIRINCATLMSANQVKLNTAGHDLHRLYSLIVRNLADKAKSHNSMSNGQIVCYAMETPIQVSQMSSPQFSFKYVQAGDYYYSDQDYTLISVPKECSQSLWLIGSSAYNTVHADSWLSLQISQPAKIWIAYDSRMLGVPQWLMPWTETDKYIQTTQGTPMKLFCKSFAAGAITLGSNYGAATTQMYVIFLQQDPWPFAGQPGAPQITSLKN
jgi:hypothetical protein